MPKVGREMTTLYIVKDEPPRAERKSEPAAVEEPQVEQIVEEGDTAVPVDEESDDDLPPLEPIKAK